MDGVRIRGARSRLDKSAPDRFCQFVELLLKPVDLLQLHVLFRSHFDQEIFHATKPGADGPDHGCDQWWNLPMNRFSGEHFCIVGEPVDCGCSKVNSRINAGARLFETRPPIIGPADGHTFWHAPRPV
jgi:hypothetical protein